MPARSHKARVRRSPVTTNGFPVVAAAAVAYLGIMSPASYQVYDLIVLTALAVGMRNAGARKLAIP
jgi:hypothetical protein